VNAARSHERPTVVSVGDNDVDIYIDHGVSYPGGNCLNVAVFAARAGAASAYIGRIGRDPAGDLIESALKAESVDARFLRRVDGATAHCLITHSNGDRIFQSSDLGVSRFVPTSDEFEFVDHRDAVHVGASSGLDAELPRLAQRALLSYDFATRRDPAHLALICPYAHLGTFSGGHLSEREAEQLATSAVDAGAAFVLVTRGSRGSILAHGNDRWRAETTPSQVVDTLGAGDSFIARLLVGLLRGEQPPAAMAAASASAAETCTSFGAFGHRASLQRLAYPVPTHQHHQGEETP
jgi:fructoselysine 6-kinase